MILYFCSPNLLYVDAILCLAIKLHCEEINQSVILNCVSPYFKESIYFNLIKLSWKSVATNFLRCKYTQYVLSFHFLFQLVYLLL